MRQQSVLRGSLWLIASAVLAKILGAVFRIQLTAMLGGTGMGYFSCAYGLFLPVFSLSVTGMNTAVSAVTAQACARQDQASAARTAVLARRMFGAGGAVCAAVLLLLTDPLCTGLLHNPRAAMAVRLFAPAIWICCMNAVLRGMYEGHQNMTPTAVSQVAEGIGRAVFGILLCGTVMRYAPQILPHLPAGTTAAEAAAAAAILGVTLSTAAGLLTLLCFPRPIRKTHLPHTPQDDRVLRRALLRILLPVAAASLVTNLTSLIDLATGMRLLSAVIARNPAAFGLAAGIGAEAAAEHANFCFGAFSGLAVTMFNLVPAVTNMLGKGVFPAFAASFTQHRQTESARHAGDVIQRTAFLAVPAGMGLSALAEPILQLLFPSRQAEIAVAAPPLVLLGIAVIFAAMSYPLFSMLQAAGFAGDTVTVMLRGAGCKLLGNLLLIPRMGLRGIALSTALCYAVILLLALRQFRLRTGISLRLVPLCGRIIFGSVLCAGTAAALCRRLSEQLPQQPALLLAIAGGGVIYLLSVCMMQRIGSRPCNTFAEDI